MSLDNIRTYEVSIWTLQDGFISVLKYANLENKGQIQEGIVDIQTDGTQNLSFSVPLYLNVDGVKQENHFWYNFINATTVVNMRKIKVALNKSEEDEKIYEFLITKVTERHEEDQAYCDVECEGLAFHELGKVGYKISLSSDKFYDDDMKWFETKKGTQPRATLDYWLGEMGLEKYSASQSLKHPTTWYYEVSMNWDAYPGEDRVSNKVYEDEYISSWKIENGKIIPDGVTVAHEKERMVDLEESNIYNLTQELAETFGVFCRYEYLYDGSEHIIGRKIVFYNNFIAEEEGYIDLSYPHSASSIHREIDSTDLVTKMYVRPVDNEFSASGQTTIMDVGANKSREDYLLNFDYLYAIGTITQEQYDEIKVYEKNIREKNNALIPIEEKLIYLSSKLIDLEASLTVATNSIQQDEERLSAASQLENELRNKYSDEYGNTIAVPTSNPRMLILITDSKAKNGTCYVNLDDTGIDVKTLKIYRNFDSTKSSQLSEELTSGILEYDEYGELIKVTNLKAPSDPAASMRVYAVYSYNPQFYYQKVIDTWTTQLYKDQENKAALEDDSDLTAETSVPAVKHQIEELEAEQTTLLEEKKKLIADFEHMMGPALREGYWQPEDYSDYGSNYTDTFMLPNTTTSISGESKKSSFIWNSEPFEDEQKTYYEIGINQDKKYYPCVDLSEHLEQVKEHIDELCFVYYDYDRINTDAAELNKRRTMPVGSLAQYGFTMKNGKIIPVLILTGIEKLPSESIDKIKSANADPVIGMLKATVSQDGREVNVVEERLFSAIGNFITLTSNSKLYFPRLKVNSLALKTSSDQLGIVYNNNVLQPFEDYYSLIRKSAYYVTLKPRALLAQGTVTGKVEFKYSISNADVAIYLDAVQVLKESAFPKVSYTVSPNFVDKTILHQTYELLNRLVHINDSDLKFQNIRGYISGVKLNLDKPQEDEIEIKNYKNKFEDLFSTIVAQTEQMKKNSYIVGMAANAFSTSGGLTSASFDATIKNNLGILKEYLKSNFDDVFVVREQLQEAFSEAGEILKDASNSLDGVKVLTTKNASILASFAESVQAGLMPQTYNSPVRPSNFKPGDVWNKTDENGNIVATYVATTTENMVETYDGSLSRITGANMTIDAKTGIVDVTGENEINLRSGKNIYIAADDNVDIVGNKAVNIGGTTINIGSASTPSNKVGGIHLVSTDGNASISKVDIMPTGIELASASGIVIKSGAGIDIKSSDSTNTSAVIIDKDKGIWLGADKGINLYSGIASDGTVTGASVAINPNKILFGVSNTTATTTAAEMTSDYMVFAAGNVSESDRKNKNITGTSSGLIGVKITKTNVGIATGSGTNINTVLMNNNGVTIGSGSIDVTKSTADLRKLTSGSYVRVSGTGIDLGSTSNLYINSNNFKLQTNTDASSGLGNTVLALGSNLNGITKDTTPAQANEKDTVNLLVNSKGAFIKGTVYATGGSFTGAVTATSFILSGSGEEDFNSAVAASTAINNITTVKQIVTTYKVSTNDTTPPTGTWSTTAPTTVAQGSYLWTRTITTYEGGNTSTSYSVTKYGVDGIGKDGEKGDTGKSVSTIQVLYYLTGPSDAAPKKPTAPVTSTATGTATWSLSVPTWINGRHYYRCEQYKWSDNTNSWSDPYIDYGITAANSTATSASEEADDIVGYLESAFNVQYSNGVFSDYTAPWGTKYKVAVTSSEGMLIGSGSGLVIADGNKATSGSAIVMNKSGIALNGATINLKASAGDSTSVVALSSTGITIGATGTINVGSGTFKINANSGQFKIDSSAKTTTPNLYIADSATWSNATSGIQYTDSGGLAIKGNITATAGTIGGWTIGSDTIGYGSGTYGKALTGMSAKGGSTIAFWAGYDTTTSWAVENIPFFVRHNGELHATSATITGTITANAGTIGGWKITSNTTGSRLYSGSGTTYVALDSGMSGATAASYAIWAGNGTAGSAPFRVTRTGALTATGVDITGKITATSGSIANWTISGPRFQSNLSFDDGGTTEWAYTCLYSGDPDSSTSINKQPLLWAGTYASSSSHSSGSASFRILRDGSVYISKLMVKDSDGKYKEINFNTYGTGGWNEDFFNSANVKVYVGKYAEVQASNLRVYYRAEYKTGETTKYDSATIDCTSIYNRGVPTAISMKKGGTSVYTDDNGNIAANVKVTPTATNGYGMSFTGTEQAIDVTDVYTRGKNDADFQYDYIGSITEIGRPPSETLYWYDRNSNVYRVYGTSVYQAGSTYNNLYQKS